MSYIRKTEEAEEVKGKRQLDTLHAKKMTFTKMLKDIK